jgi:hypothetical protein
MHGFLLFTAVLYWTVFAFAANRRFGVCRARVYTASRAKQPARAPLPLDGEKSGERGTSQAVKTEGLLKQKKALARAAAARYLNAQASADASHASS